MIVVHPVDLAVCIVEGAGARTLEAAAGLGLGTRILVVSQTDGITVNGVTINDGVGVEFVVILNSSGNKAWGQMSDVTDYADVLLDLGVVEGRLDDIQAAAEVTGDIKEYSNTTMQLILDALDAAGIIVDSTTDTT